MPGLTITVGGSDITAYVDVRSLSIEEVATGGLVATCRFSVRDHSGTVSIDEKDVVDIDDDGTTIFAGEVVEITDGQEGITKTWGVVCQDNNILLDETVVEAESYEATVSDAFILGDAVDGLFPQYRSDIDASTYVATVDGSMEAVEFVGMTLRECLDDLCRRTGARYYVDYDKKLHYFATEVNAAGFSLSTSPNGTTSFGFGGFRRTRSAARLANKVFVLGKEVSNWISDNDSIVTYGERHAVSRDERITTAQGITDRGNAILDRYDLPRASYELWTEKDGLRAGMSVSLTNATWGITNQTFYIRRIRTEFVGRDGERRRYHLSLNDEQIEPAKTARQASLTIATIETQITTIGDTVFDTDAPAAPVLETANLTTDVDIDADGHQVVYLQVTWSAVADADLDHYLVQVSTSSDFSGYTWSRSHPAGGSRIERFVGLLGNTTYYARVRAVDWSGNDSAWSTTRSKATAKDTTAPAQVAGLVAAGSRTLIGIQWTANTEGDLKHYEIQRAPDVTGAPGDYVAIALARLNFYVDQDFTSVQIAAQNTFWYRVRAVDSSDNSGDWATATSAALSQIGTDYIAALAITAAKIAANTITADKMSVSQLSAIAADMGTITAGTVTGATIRTAAAGARVLMDSTDGIRCFNASAAETFQVDVDGSGHIGASGGVTPPLTWNAAGQFQRIQANQLQIGESFFNTADGLLLLGPHCEITTTTWKSLRGQVATLSGAFHQTQGMWLNTRGLVIEEATTNLMTNPSFEVGTTGWTNAGFATFERITTDSRFGVACLRTYDAAVAVADYIYSDFMTVTATNTYTLSAVIRKVACTGTGQLEIFWYTGVDVYISKTSVAFDSGTHGWKRYSVSGAAPGTAAKARIVLISTGAGGAAWDVYLDGVQFEEKAYATSYCDGSLGYGYAWTGTAHASTSTRAANECNLDAHIALISTKTAMSFRLVCQAPYGANDTWPATWSTFMDATSNDFTDRVFVMFTPATKKVCVYLSDDPTFYYLTSSEQSFVKGDWLDIVVTLDYTNDSYKLYVNGVLEDTDTTALGAPTIEQWNLGSYYDATFQTGAAFCEFAVFGRVLAANEVSQLFELQQPLVDTGSMQTPGIYILDGRFRIASSSTGTRVEITASEIAGYNGATKQFYLQASDGKAYAGAGAVMLDSNGITITAGSGRVNSIVWNDGSDIAQMFGYKSGATDILWVHALAPDVGDSGMIILDATNQAGSVNSIYLVSPSVSGYPTAGCILFGMAGTNRLQVLSTGVKVIGDSRLTDGIAAPAAEVGYAIIYVDSADGDLKVRFGDGFIRTIAADS